MKTMIRRKILWPFTGAALVYGLILHVNAQDTNVDWGSASDDQVILQAIELTTPTPSNEVPAFATFYSAQHSPISAQPWPPLPADVEHFGGWDLGSNIWVLDDLDFDYNTVPAQSGQSMMAMDSSPPIPGGGGGSTNPPPYFPGAAPRDYGSNLWIQCQGIVTNSFVGIISNTQPDIQYQILSAPSLLQTNWNSEGFVFGSEITNWTAFAVNIAGRTNNSLFFTILSWQDSYDMGIPDWWQLKYFGYIGIDLMAIPPGMAIPISTNTRTA